jgi:hypothetical protein
MMLRKQWAAGLLLIAAMVLAACGSPAQSAVQPATPAPPATEAPATTVVSPLPTPAIAQSPLATPGAELADLSGLIAALEAAGATVEPGDRIEQPFFEVQGQALRVNGESVEVFEWADEASREAVSRTITRQGQFGATMLEWTGTPHFWASGKIIVLYVGQDAKTVELLTGALGAPITEG